MKEYHISSYLVYNIVSFCKMDGKQNLYEDQLKMNLQSDI